MNISINLTKRGLLVLVAVGFVLLCATWLGYRQITKSQPVEAETAQQEMIEDQSAGDEAIEDQTVEPQDQSAQVAESSEQ